MSESFDVGSLRSKLSAHSAEISKVLAANQDAQVGLLVDGLESLALVQREQADRMAESERRLELRCQDLESSLTTKLQAILERTEGKRKVDSSLEMENRISALESSIATMAAQVDTVVKALKEGNRARRNALSVTTARKETAPESTEVKEAEREEKTEIKGAETEEKIEIKEAEAEENKTYSKEEETTKLDRAMLDIKEEVCETETRIPADSANTTDSAFLTDLSDLMDDGKTAAKLIDLEDTMMRRLGALEKRAADLANSRAGMFSNLEYAKRDEPPAINFNEIIVPIAEKTAHEVVTREIAKTAGEGTSMFELRRDINAVSRFADELQDRCEAAFLAANAYKATAKKKKEDEAAARRRCRDILLSFRDAAAARRRVVPEDAVDVNSDVNYFVEYVDSVATTALEAMAQLRMDFGDGEEVDDLPPSFLLSLRVFSSLLDTGLDEGSPTESLSFSSISEETWNDAIKRGLPAVTELLDRHSSTAQTQLDIVRLRAEFHRLPDSEKFSLKDDPIPLMNMATPWRLSERTSEILRGFSRADFVASPGDLGECLRKALDQLYRHDVVLNEARGIATLAQRHATSLDSAMQELVAQMQHGFASRQDFAIVEKSLARLGDKLKSATSDIQKHTSIEFAEKLKALQNQLRETAARSPDYCRIEQLLATKATVDDIKKLKGRLDNVVDAQDQQLIDQSSSDVFGTLISKCLACNRPFGSFDTFVRAPPPPTVPPGALATSGSRIPSVMPSTGYGIVPDHVGASVEMRPPSSHATYSNALHAGAYTTPPPKKNVSLKCDGVHDSDVVISRAGGASGRLMPIAPKRAPPSTTAKKGYHNR